MTGPGQAAPGPARRRRYHHGDLRQALIETAIEMLGERGAEAFSMAEASRRLGVAASAPYRHFADRDALLAAVALRAADLLGVNRNTLRKKIRELDIPVVRGLK